MGKIVRMLEVLEAEYRVGQAVIRCSKRSGLPQAVEGLAGTEEIDVLTSRNLIRSWRATNLYS